MNPVSYDAEPFGETLAIVEVAMPSAITTTPAGVRTNDPPLNFCTLCGAGDTETPAPWPLGTKLGVKFLPGESAPEPIKEIIKSTSLKWINGPSEALSLEWVSSSDPAEVRISFYNPHSNWSFLGATAASAAQSGPTMNFRFGEWQAKKMVFSHIYVERVAAHLFGHALGLPHARAPWSTPWNESGLTKAYGSSYADRAKAEKGYARLRSPQSIMHLDRPAACASGSDERYGGSEIDAEAREIVRNLYPTSASVYCGFQPISGGGGWDGDWAPRTVAISTSKTSKAITGLRLLELGPNNDLGFHGSVQDVQRNASFQLRIDFHSPRSTRLLGIGFDTMAFDEDDQRIQTDRLALGQIRPKSTLGRGEKVPYRVNFTRSFNQIPKVVAVLAGFEVDKGTNVRVHVHATNIDREGFTLNFDSWADTMMRDMYAYWLAHESDDPTIRSGRFDRARSGSSQQSQSFDSPMRKRPRTVFCGFSYIDCPPTHGAGANCYSSVTLRLQQQIDLSGITFTNGFTLEAWVHPYSFWVDSSESQSDKGETEAGKDLPLPPPGSLFCLFSQAKEGCPTVFLDDHLRLVLRQGRELKLLAASKDSLVADAWNHVAVTYVGENTRTFSLVVNGVASDSGVYVLPPDSAPGVFAGFASQAGKPECLFQGLLDEARLWSHPLHLATIRAKMATRATGMEPFLEACWHFDEGTGTTAFDATVNGHDLEIVLKDQAQQLPKIWEASSAPLVANFGLGRRVLRLAPTVSIQGGLGASVYYEQVSISQAEQKPEDQGSANGSESKPMKRSARVLLCFVASSKSNPQPRLAVLDFGLLSDGTLCDSPATIPLPNLALSANSALGNPSVQRASTAIIYMDVQGMELFGGLLEFEGAQCGPESPCVWDSATGSITVFFRSVSGLFSALVYDVSRSIVASAASVLGEHHNVLAASKLRQAKKITIQTKLCPWAPKEVAVNLELTAQMDDGSKITELWQGIPSSLDRLCNLMNGINIPGTELLGELERFEPLTTSTVNPNHPRFTLWLSTPLDNPVLNATCLVIGFARYQVLQDAQSGDQIITVSLYLKKKLMSKLQKDQKVFAVGYEHKELIKCQDQAVGDLTRGSTMIAMINSESAAIDTTWNAKDPSQKGVLVNAPGESSISGYGQSPFFASPPRSTALQLANDSVYSMLEEATTTTYSSGIAFESWIKVDQVSESVIVAYTSQRAARSERTSPERQTFVLGIPALSNGSNEYDLVGNVNGSLFLVKRFSSLQRSRWMHFACSARNTFALRFSGSNYVDLGAAVEWNVSDFALAFTLQLDQISRDQLLFTKALASSSNTPFQVKITAGGSLCLSYWAEGEDGSAAKERSVTSPSASQLTSSVPYKVFISRKLVHIKKNNAAPRPFQLVTMRVWGADGTLCLEMTPPSVSSLEESERSGRAAGYPTPDRPAQACGPSQGNEAPLLFGGAPWSANQGVVGSIGPIQLYSSAIAIPATSRELFVRDNSERSLVGAWSFGDAASFALTDDMGRNHGKLKKDPDWVLSPYELDHQLSVFVNGTRVKVERAMPSLLLQTPTGAHQLTLGNTIHGDDTTRYFGLRNAFRGELDELRIWNVPRTKENFCDLMYTRLSEIPTEVAVYLPFDSPEAETSAPNTTAKDIGILADASINCWHLTPLHAAKPVKVTSEAPISHDAPCVNHVLSAGGAARGVATLARPSVAEYGDMQVSASGGMEGSFKRAYSYIDSQGQWCLVTGFRIGTLVTEWVSQVQTSPTLIGYIEGAPPIPVDSFLDPRDRPSSSIRFSNAQRCTYSYSSRTETINDYDLSINRGMGAKWQASAGIGVETEITAGEIKGGIKNVIDVSNAQIGTSVSTSTTNTNLEMRLDLTGAWIPDKSGTEVYEAANTGLALVESEVADVFALRLKMRGPVAPLVAYQMRPNSDIPKDRNLVSFVINSSYTKQGCLDGRRGLDKDSDYPLAVQAPKDASYFKPVEAYALKDRIRRDEEQRQGEYERFQVDLGIIDKGNAKKDLPKRTHRNICNSYVWTADGGTFQETHSTMDMVQCEVGGTSNQRISTAASFDMELAFSTVLAIVNVDAMYSAHYNLMMTKEQTSDSAFELQAELPPSVDIRQRDHTSGKLVKRPGAVDAYRWMSFWLEPSVEATDCFFQQVVDPQWVGESPEPNARLLRSLRDDLRRQTGNARTKAWRVLHRCTYVSRVPAPVEANLAGAAAAAAAQSSVEEGKKSTLLADVACNWRIIQRLEPLVRGAKSRAEVAHLARPHVASLYPSLLAQPRFYVQLLELLADYIGIQ